MNTDVAVCNALMLCTCLLHLEHLERPSHFLRSNCLQTTQLLAEHLRVDADNQKHDIFDESSHQAKCKSEMGTKEQHAADIKMLLTQVR